MKIERVKAKAGGWEWKVDATIGGQRIRESGFATKKALDDFILELKVQAKRRRFGLANGRPLVTVAELVEERITDLDLTSPNHRAAVAVLRKFTAHFEAGFLVVDIRTADLRSFVKERQKRAVAVRKRKLEPGTINKDLIVISRVLRLAPELFAELEEWRPPRIPWERISRRGRERIIAPAERKAILEGLRLGGSKSSGRALIPEHVEARRDAADSLELSLHTGMRGMEVRSVKWIEVDFDAAEVHLPKTKNREPRDIPLNWRALEVLRRRWEKRRSAWVFPNKARTGPRPASYTPMIRKVAKRLGLRYGRELEDGFTPHTARHTAATEMMRARIDPSAVQKVLGHSDHVMTLRYTHADREGMRTAVESLAPRGPQAGGPRGVALAEGPGKASSGGLKASQRGSGAPASRPPRLKAVVKKSTSKSR